MLELAEGLSIRSEDPVDDRYVFNTVDDALATLPVKTINGRVSTRRYVGLSIFVASEDRNYQFQGGISDECFVPLVDPLSFSTNENGERLVVQGVTPRVVGRELKFDFKVVDVATGVPVTKTVSVEFDDPLLVTIGSDQKVSVSVDADFSGGGGSSGSGGTINTKNFLKKGTAFVAVPENLLKLDDDGNVDVVRQVDVHGWVQV